MRLEFTFHNSYVIPELVTSTVIFWTELIQKLLKQGYVAPRLKSWLQEFYGGHNNLVDRYKISISQMKMDLLILGRCFLSSITAKTFTGLDCIYE